MRLASYQLYQSHPYTYVPDIFSFYPSSANPLLLVPFLIHGEVRILVEYLAPIGNRSGENAPFFYMGLSNSHGFPLCCSISYH